jgi:hypothetical protein
MLSKAFDGMARYVFRRHRPLFIIHVGLHKTGTTSIQNFLAKNALELKRNGFLYPNGGCPENSSAHHNLAWQLAGDKRFNPAYGTVEKVVNETVNFPGNIIISSEDFENILGDTDRILPLTENVILSGRDIILVIYVRDQVSYAESLYLEMMKHGMSYTAKEFFDVIVEGGRVSYREWVFHFEYDLIRRLKKRISVRKLIVRPYRSIVDNSSVTDLLHVIRCEQAELSPESGPRYNKRIKLVHGLARFYANKRSYNAVDLGRRLDEAFGSLLGSRSAGFALPRRHVMESRFHKGNWKLAREFGFSGNLLCRVDDPRQGDFDIERLFSEQTVEAIEGWLAGDSGRLTRLLMVS